MDAPLPRPGAPRHVNRSLHEEPGTADVVSAALADFALRNAGVTFPPVVIVIAALDEEESLPSVLEEIPAELAGLATRVLVVDDGSTDRTSGVAEQYGAFVCRLERNCGHGVALRAGYRLAREGGCRHIATLDADGQWDPADLPGMIALLEADRADFVVGSRQLGSTANTDPLRNLGVRFFSGLISVLTSVQITDSSSGLRAMRAALTGTVRQTQPQYQTSELLISAILQGYRVAEVPTAMRVRRAGRSRKGHNLLFGARYARVILSTYLRERLDPRPRAR
jgi:glycosyltransferase involved in cell wall biosynthesis